MRHALLCNSGSSANLLAISALHVARGSAIAGCSEGDEVITVAAGFPTTVNPIVQNGLVPVFVDVELGTYDASRRAASRRPSARRPARSCMAHTLGNPFDLDAVIDIAHGARPLARRGQLRRRSAPLYDGKLTGTFGDLATLSFYPAHHITMGEGGCVLTSRAGA